MSEMDDLVRKPDDDSVKNWMPQCLVEIEGKMMGVTMDDGCYLVLVREFGGGWKPIKWIPREAAIFIGTLAGGESKELSSLRTRVQELEAENKGLREKVGEADKALNYIAGGGTGWPPLTELDMIAHLVNRANDYLRRLRADDEGRKGT